jgi:hypothetical protein
MHIFNVVNRKKILFSETTPQRKTIILLKNTLFCREFSGLSEYVLTFEKAPYLAKEPSKILNSTTMRKLTFRKWDHGGVFISFGKFFTRQELDMIKMDILIENFTGYRMV